MTRQSVCEWLDQEYHELLRGLMTLTDSNGREHGFSVVGYPDDHEATKIISGSHQSIDITTETTSAFLPVRVGVHTHPSGSIVPSDSDWRSFLTEYSQYTPDAEWPDGWRHAEVILGRRLGEEDTFGMKAIELTEEGVGLGIEEQHEWTNRGFEVISEEAVGSLGTTEEIADAIGPQVSVCTHTVEDEQR